MKKLPLRSRSSSVRKVACTVSAAALMLGVSHAATVAMHFQCNYCSFPGYNGQTVSLTAFGVPPSGWQNLTPMSTGYNSCPISAPPYGYTLNETISTNTSTGGLNPLPRGTINITWSAGTANFSDFGGYIDTSLSPPYNIFIESFTGVVFGGEDQVYASFLRDGINFGPPGGADNTGGFGGYSVDMTGVKSVFTNTPYVVELIAASDSMNVLTNAFVIDAGNSITNSVSYPSTPPISNVGDAPWPRGHGGGLSTASAQMNADHVHIMSNQPQHGGSGASGYNNAGNISGFIITDQPVVTMSPRPVPVGLGDTVTWSAYAIGVPPLSYQWLKNGVPIPGATSVSLSLANVTAADVGAYALLVTNLYGTATSSVVRVDQVIQTPTANMLVDSNPEGPAHNGMNSGATWLASYTDSNGTNLPGMSFNGSNSQITVPAFNVFNATNGTVMFWMQTTNIPAGASAVVFDRRSDINNEGIRMTIDIGGYLDVQGPSTLSDSTAPVADGNWHHVAISYDESGANPFSLYVDGTLAEAAGAAAFSFQTNQEIELGLSNLGFPRNVSAQTQIYLPFQGLMSDFRFYTTNLTSDQIASVYSSGALADTNDLAARLSFAAPPSAGLLETWQVPDGILQSAPSINGPWTDVGVLQTKYLTLPSKPALFYRYRGHTPVTQVSNPYLM